ncbi:MAG: hypothetical protein HND51_02785 [Chloroflexi bacterium]|nr:hypothetical protein [Chloroflexota bacterium]
MNKNKRFGCILIAVLLGGVLLVAAFVGGSLVFTGQTAAASQPLVLIHSPLNHEEFNSGEGLIMHATARSKANLTHIELWADNELVHTEHAPEGEAASPLVLSRGWEAATLGKHTLVVRAFSTIGAAGQASVVVNVVESDVAQLTAPYIVQEGDTVESIAAGTGISTDELIENNPDLGSGLPTGGEVVDIPVSDGPSGSGLPPVDEPEADDETPPDPHGEAPSSGFDFPLLILEFIDPEPEELYGLRVEALTLEADAAYESLHCYVSMAERTPQWYPDRDGDQTTDESFDPLGGTAWDVAAHLSSFSAPLFPWPSNQELPLEVNCVGITGGGTDAVELGQVALSVPPEDWDGVIRQATSSDGEGGFTLGYRISQEEIHFLDLNPDMARPTNLWIDYEHSFLHWSYQPNTDPEPEEPIDGFLVFINETLVFTVPAEERFTPLPDAWLHPPCGDDYIITMRAYHHPYPEGDYSYPSSGLEVSSGELGDESCNTEFVVTFTRLTTSPDLPEDPWPNNWAHAVGPIYGSFFANDQSVDFEYHYLIPDFSYEGSHLTSGAAAQVVVEVPPEEILNVGFNIIDEEDGVDELLCWSNRTHRYDELFYGFQEFVTIDPVCNLYYTVQHVTDSPGGAGEGSLPLPWLELVDVTVAPTGRLQIHLHNTGTAAWSTRDIEIEVTRHSGEPIGTIRRGLQLAVGETIIIEDVNIAPEHPQDVCVTLDPNDEVLELYEHTDTRIHNPYCLPLPDMTITDARFDSVSDNLYVTVHNRGEEPIDYADVEIGINFADGETALLPFESHLDGSMAPWDSYTLSWRRGTVLDRDSMAEGYTIVADPRDRLAESDEDNNEFAMRGSNELSVYWFGVCTPLYVDGGLNEVTAHLDIYAGGQLVASFTAPRIEYRSSWEDYDGETECWYSDYPMSYDHVTPFFDISGDELLEIHSYAELDAPGSRLDGSIGGSVLIVYPHDLSMIEPYGTCGSRTGPGAHRLATDPDRTFGQLGDPGYDPWFSYFAICQIER